MRKWQREDNREGSLNSEQHLLWDGPWPDEARRQHLPDLLERAHFRSVERYSSGIVRCRREGPQVVCRLFDWHRLPALVFVDSGTRVTADLVEREWVIGPGLMARRGPAADAPYGSLRVGLQRVEEHGVTRVHAYERVEGFPSRFLRQPDALAGNARSWGWAQVGALYSAYHARAAFGALRWIAAVLNQGQSRERAREGGPRSWPAVQVVGAARGPAPAAHPPPAGGSAGSEEEEQRSRPVLLTGASGFVGGHLRPALEGAGFRVRGVTRDVARARRRAPEAEWVEADLDSGAGLERALEGCGAAYYLVHGMGEGAGFREREVRAAERFAAAAGAAGVERIVYLGGIAPAGPPSEHLLSRLEVGEALRGGPVPALELRASMIVGQGSLSWLMVRDLAARLPAMVLPRWLRSQTEPVAVEDVVAALVGGLRLPLAQSASYDLPGPDLLTGRAVLEETAGALGLRPPLVLEVPLLSPRLSSHWVRLVTRADWEVARNLVEGLRNDLLARDAAYWERIGHGRLLHFAEGARRALAAERRAGRPGGIGGAVERLVGATRGALDPALAPERQPQGAVQRQGQEDGPQVGHGPA